MSDNLQISTQVAFSEHENNVTVHLDDVYRIDVLGTFIRVHCLDGHISLFDCQLSEIFVKGVKLL